MATINPQCAVLDAISPVQAPLILAFIERCEKGLLTEADDVQALLVPRDVKDYVWRWKPPITSDCAEIRVVFKAGLEGLAFTDLEIIAVGHRADVYAKWHERKDAYCA